MKKLPYPHPVFNVDGTLNHHGTITHACNLLVTKGNKREHQRFFVTNLGRDRLLFGYPWFKAFKPEIDWEKGTLLGPKCYVLGLTQGAFFIFHLLTKPFPSRDQPPIHLDHMTNHLTSHLTTHMTSHMPFQSPAPQSHLSYITCSQVTCTSPETPSPDLT